jgi:hypothetical protein
VKLITYDSIKSKVDNLISGFFSIVNQKAIQIFTVDELDFMISGQIDIDIEDWKKNTIYKGHYNENHKVNNFYFKILNIKQYKLNITNTDH